MDYENALWNGNIPMDLVKDILLRLPAKALGRCMCTCKKLYSHIKSTQFMKSHSNHSKSRENTILIVQQGCYSIFSESDTTLIKQESGRIPFPVMDGDLFILGSCRGLVLVRLKVAGGFLVLLWNPSLEKFKVIDTVIFERSHGNATTSSSWFRVYALGFHEASNDYRVVRITRRYVVDVYSFTNNNWHSVEGILANGNRLPTISYPGKMAIYTNGVVHWLASYDEDDFWFDMYCPDQAMGEPEEERYVVLSFDFDKEVFKLIELPGRYSCYDFLYFPLELKELNGKLALFDGSPYALYDTWVMMNYPLVESWTCVGCLFENCVGSWGEHETYFVCTKKENCISKRVSVLQRGMLRYFNAKEDKIYELEILAPYECPVIVDFVECLVLLDVDENDAPCECPVTSRSQAFGIEHCRLGRK